MARPPRKKNESILTRPLLARVLTSSFVILLGTTYVFITELEDGAVSDRDTTMTFTTFVLFDLFNALSCRHNSRPGYQLQWNSNPAFIFALLFSIVGQFLVIYFPPFQQVFRTVSITTNDLFYLTSLASTIFIVDIIRKLCFPSWFIEKDNGNGNMMTEGKGREIGMLKSEEFIV